MTAREQTLTITATLASGSLPWVCQLASARSSCATVLRAFHLAALKVGGPGLLLTLSILRVRVVVVEVNRGLHRETGQYLLPRTLQIFLTLRNG